MESQNVGFFRLKNVLEIIPLSRSSWLSGVKEGRFPAPVHLGPRTVAWSKSAIHDLAEKLSKGIDGGKNEAH